MAVHSELGCGFLEKVYEKSLCIELGLRGIAFQRQVPFEIKYKTVAVGRYFSDLIVENNLLLELKAINSLTTSCESQLLHYLKASGLHLGILLNFGSGSLQIKRMTTTPRLTISKNLCFEKSATKNVIFFLICEIREICGK